MQFFALKIKRAANYNIQQQKKDFYMFIVSYFCAD